MDSPLYDVLSFGTLGIDRILHLPHWPAPHISTHTIRETVTLGGKATNTAVLLAAWGSRVAISGTTLGTDDIGNLFKQMISQYPRISTEFVEQRNDVASMYCCILVNQEGERAIIGVNTSSVIPTQPLLAMVESTKVITLDLYGGVERVDIAQMAHETGRPVIVGDLRDAIHPVLPFTTIAIASASELRDSNPRITLDEFAQRCIQAGLRAVAITDAGDAIQIYVNNEKHILIPPAVSVVDATGAGDAFRAGMTYGVLKGWDLLEAAALGISAGSLTVQHIGAASNPPDLNTAWELAKEILRRSGGSTCRKV